jgi:predicted CXXCH cytochrome family protein
MFTHRHIKLALLGVFVLLASAWLITDPVSTTAGTAVGEPLAPISEGKDDRYVGSETCAACHDAQFKKVGATKHGKLHTLSAWKGKVVGCESCHGPGKEHVEGGGDKSKIVSFKALDAKAASETCLSCHAGKEQHNNFRRGDHWRNNIGCIQCHAAHGPDPANFKPASTTLTADVAAQKPGQATQALLRSNEPQLCIGCHTEIKSQFNKPFRHRVLEGAMTCSDCHNPHGGFETKQTKLAVGTDAACIKCHSNKQGPFVFEHAPLKLEGCSTCHTPHGASNPKMLKRNSVRQLCLECHSSITEQLAPDTPSFHNQAVLRYQNCTICHAAIHGSNSSSVFFR